MGAKSNGHAKGPKGATMNGQPNGSIHNAEGKRSSRSSRRKSKSKSKKGYTGWLVDKAAKLTIWYVLVTVLFRCPSTEQDITDDSPAVCKRYFQGRDLVTPYAKPYYDQYAAPYVQRAQPYVDRVNEQAYQPALAVYKQHGAPRVAQALEQALVQWEKTIKPQLEVARQQVGQQYDATLAPHVRKAQDAVQPYYDSVKTSANDIWELEVGPVYRKTSPYAYKMYTQGQQFAVNTALPYGQYAGSAAWSFWARQIWPKMRVLYGENVEPQLFRITERLGRYKDEKKLQAEVKSMESSSSLTEVSSSAASAASSVSSFASAAAESPMSALTSSTSEALAESTASVAEQFGEDLKSWEQVCSKAVDEGAEDLKERIKEITDHQIKHQVSGTGNALITQLEETSTGTVNSIKARILSVVAGIPEDADDERVEEANDSVTQAIRNAGQTVKHSAQSIRDWRAKYDSETTELVDKALQSTLETIDSIRELRLTEIGRKYSDKGLAHKEWSKYNELKKATQAWRDDVEKVAGSSNPDLKKAKAAGEEVEHRGMGIAEDVAKELARLKGVAKGKIAERDAEDDFETKQSSGEKVKEKVEDTVSGASEAVLGSSSEPAKSSAQSATSVASEEAGKMASSASEAVSSSTGSVESLASKASEKVVPESQPSVESATREAKSVADDAYASAAGAVGQAPLRDSVSKASNSASSVASDASESVVGTSSSLTDSATDAASKASESVIGTPSSMTDSATDAASSMSSSLSSKAGKASAGTLGPKAASILAAGKARKDAASQSAASTASDGSSVAASVGSQASETPSSLADEATSSLSSVASQASEAPSSIADEAASGVSSAASGASEAAADAPSQASKKVWGGAMAQVLVEAREPILDDVVDDDDTPYSQRIQSMANAAKDQANQLTRAVQDAIMPTASEQGAVESVSSVASEQYESAMSAASNVLVGTGGSASSASSAAKEQYDSAVTA